jgi:hypothetical protein
VLILISQNKAAVSLTKESIEEFIRMQKRWQEIDANSCVEVTIGKQLNVTDKLTWVAVLEQNKPCKLWHLIYRHHTFN